VIFSSFNLWLLKLPDTLKPLAVSANLTLETPAGLITIRDADAELIEVQVPDKAAFRHLLLGLRPQLSWIRYRSTFQQFAEVSGLTFKVMVGEEIYLRISPDRPNFVYLVPLIVQYLRAKLNL